MKLQLTAGSLALFAVLSGAASSHAQSFVAQSPAAQSSVSQSSVAQSSVGQSSVGQTSIVQEEQYQGSRKIVTRVSPQYPDMARSIQLRGTVKAEALVEASGVVKNVEVKGGNPVLGRAAQNAIYKWKWAPAAHQTHEPIEVRFDPQ